MIAAAAAAAKQLAVCTNLGESARISFSVMRTRRQVRTLLAARACALARSSKSSIYKPNF